MAAPVRQIEYNAWAAPLYYPHGQTPYDYMLAEGGRGSSKTFEVTQALAIKGHQAPLRIAIAREHLKSIDESAKPELEDRMRRLGLLRDDCYRTTKSFIDHKNGTHFFFIGLSKLSEEDIKGLAMVDLVWIEEAHRMSHASWELLVPTIRKDNAQIWATWNPKYRTDAVSKFLTANRHDARVWHAHVTWRDNRYFTARNNRDRLRYKQENPERYPHIWEGHFDDVADKRKVLPYALVEMCMEAWDRRPKPRGAFAEAGLDVADTGDDFNSLVLRAGPEMFHLDKWRGSMKFTPSDTAKRAGRTAVAHSCGWLVYDMGGPGAGIRGPLREAQIPIRHEGAQFGGKVQGPEVLFSRRPPKSNEEFFANWASQAGWNLRVRAELTQRLVKGDPIDPATCLFINPEIPHVEDYLAQLAQAEWDDGTGKLKIDKQPHEAGEPEPPSPDDYDATVLAYSRDCRRGLREQGIAVTG